MKFRVVVGSLATAFVLTFALGAASSSGGRPSLGFAKPKTATLDNGLELVVEENHQARSVALQLRYRVGARDDPEGQAGLALLTQRMMTRATQHLPEGAYHQTFEDIGASRWTEATGVEGAWFNVVVPSNAVETVLWMWSDQMGFFLPRVDKPLLDQQRRAVEADFVARHIATPYGNVQAITLAGVYPDGHPYRSALTDSAAPSSVTTTDVKTFFDTHYMPNRAALIFSGDIDLARATALSKKYFGAIPSGADDPELDAKVAPLEGEVRLDVAAHVDAPMVQMAWPSAPYFKKGDSDLDLASRLLDGSHTDLLNWHLVGARKVALHASAWQLSRELGSVFVIDAVAAPGHTADELVAAIDEVLADFRTRIAPAALLERAASEFLLPKVFGLEDAQTRVGLYGLYAQLVGDSGYLERDFLRTSRVTAASVHDAAVRYLDPRRRVLTRVFVDVHAPPGGELRATSFVPVASAARVP